ncbi:MAG: hypothetical protein QOJ16_3901 [Acidobacteriota bacterium]|nr:hypothetical protein [Acidobacteriota bacterium]
MDTKKKWIVLPLLVFASLFPSAPTNAAVPCHEVKLKEQPLWVSSATYLDQEQAIVLIDPFRNKLVTFTEKGEAKALPNIQVKKGVEFEPTEISRTRSGGFLLEQADGTLTRLDRSLRPVGTVSLQAKNAQGYRVGSMYQWKVAGDSIVAYGALYNGKQVELAFFRVPLEGKSQPPERLMALADSDFYLIGQSYITAIGDTAYYVAMGKNPALYKVAPGRKPVALKAFPDEPELRTRPDFKTRMTGPNSAPKHFAELESFNVVAGLFAQDGMLYLLVRKAGDWFLYQIDPAKDKILSPEGGVRLPTTAHHLTVVPSKAEWYFIERGPVEERQQQKIDRMLVVDSAAIAASATLPNLCPTK